MTTDLYRKRLTLVIDVASRMVGLYVRESFGPVYFCAAANRGLHLALWSILALPHTPRYGGHIERGFGTWLTQARRLKGTTSSNVEQKGGYDSEGRAIMTRAELEKRFTIYVTKVYANKFHKGIKTTQLAKYKEGIFGIGDRPAS